MERLAVSRRPTVVADYAVCLVKAGLPDLAAQWIDRTARDFPDRRVDYEGTAIGLAELRRRLVGHVIVELEPLA